MQAILTIALETVALALVCAMTNLAVLALRNPHRGAFLRRRNIEDIAAAICVTAILTALSFLGNSIFTLFPTLLGGALPFVLVAGGLWLGIDYAMSMERRLKACDNGHSPFAAHVVSAADAPIA
ncbi:MAG: hypothetical protein KKB37_06955 [Alphaproteobacteria bacterium]|nr:hypothetical protein [Alphaproteobacteria bacterium]